MVNIVSDNENKYLVVTAKNELALESKVDEFLNKRLSDGRSWKLAGGVSVVHDGGLGSTPTFYQAIYKAKAVCFNSDDSVEISNENK